MRTIRVRSWEGFEKALKSVDRSHGVYRRPLKDGRVLEKSVLVLFRGQSSAQWPLQTTLERRTSQRFNVSSYLELVSRAVPELETFTGARWGVLPFPELKDEIRKKSDTFRVHLPCYDFLVYLRHHGYPSPLLDWTESPYVAAYFAYLGAGRANPAVYCYVERPQLVKGGSGGDSMISVKGPFVRSDRRHFAQRSWYTVATRWDYKEEEHVFCPHDEVFVKGDDRQDLLVKIVLPVRERGKAMRQLSQYNINHFTLFQSEDALVKALESKHFDLDV